MNLWLAPLLMEPLISRVGTGATADAITACAGIDTLDPEVSGLTISFSGELTGACTLIDTFDADADADTLPGHPPLMTIAFEITTGGSTYDRPRRRR